MKDLHHFVIEGESGGFTSKITLDGVDLKGVTRLTLDVDANDRRTPTRLLLEFIPGAVSVDVYGKLTVNGEER